MPYKVAVLLFKMDLSLHGITRLSGEAAARQTAAYIEYVWQPQ